MKMASPVKPKRLRPSIESSSKGLNLSWVPNGYELFFSFDFGNTGCCNEMGVDLWYKS
jgi:hypothetical protein